ncbi:hypothetical protein BaRGS_00035975 [Batillaria attramentaria]|uniref:Polysaccharide lyase 14 domain-containing protein n=1 Tax=Batillaria attramentaria TaxID=370345 RepID=A0ABD0JD82_9CAEN
MQFTLTFAAAMVTFAVAMELPISRHFTGGFQCDFCYTAPERMHGWTAHVVFEHAIDNLEIYNAILTDTRNGGKDFVVQNGDYNGNLEQGEDLCLKFTARTHNTNLPKVYFYIEGVDRPIDPQGHSHPIPSTTLSPELTQAHALWMLKNMDGHEDNMLRPFVTQSGGHFDEGSLSVSDDPAAGQHGKVLRVFYQKGHYVSVHSHRGAQFYGRPTHPRNSMTLSYDLFFSPGFDFVKGGKLPGLFGGGTTCSGGRHSDDCFSTRLMWRTNGDGEVYGYIPEEQVSGFCNEQDIHCNAAYGNSIGRGSWRFKAGVWQNVAQRVELNTPGQTNGKLKVWYNGHLVLERNDINFRNKDLQLEGIFFSTFFGGSDPSWAPTADCYTYYKNFVISDVAHPSIIG